MPRRFGANPRACGFLLATASSRNYAAGTNDLNAGAGPARYRLIFLKRALGIAWRVLKNPSHGSFLSVPRRFSRFSTV